MSSIGKCLVTGVSGFVGKALAKELHKRGYEVVGLARREVQDLKDLGIKVLIADISFEQNLKQEYFQGIKTVFHVAAKVDMWGDWKDFYQTNVVGTQNLIFLSKTNGVKNFIFTSSPSVVADGTNLKGVDESKPYPEKFLSFYPQTKVISEKFVLSSHSEDFRTIALRPHLIFGPGDTGLTLIVVEKAKKGQLVIVGKGENKVDFTFIDDCVDAHILAAQGIDKDFNVGGKPYFITQGEPYLLWEWVNKVLACNNMPPLKKKVSLKFAFFMASLMEFFSRITGKEPRLTRFLVEEMATDHYFSIESARKNLGYNPKISIDEAIKVSYH